MKKLFKNSYIALAVLALGFSACTEEVEYTPAGAPTNEQVYFSNTNSAQIDLAKEATSFDIAVSRAIAGTAANIDVFVTADDDANSVFEFPTTVEFADSATTAVYTVNVKEGVELEYDSFHNITLAFDEAVSTPYGNSSYSFKVGVPAPWSEWASITGHEEATYNFTQYVNGSYPVSVSYREHMLEKNKAQFMFHTTEIGTLSNLIVDYDKTTGNCQVSAGQAFLTSSTYGTVFVTDLVNYPFTIKDDAGNPIEMTYEDWPCTYNAETGLFTLNLIYYVDKSLGSAASGYFAYGTETVQLSGFTQPDYSFSMNFRGHYVNNEGIDNAVISTTKGADVAKYLMTVVSADEDLEATVNGMLDGSVVCDTLTESGFYAYPITESGNYIALAVTLDAKGNTIDAHTTEFEFWMVGEDNPWESLGMAKYTEDCLTTFFNVPNEVYEVEVRQNKDNPGLYRIIHPYAAYGADTSKEYFIEIDATDPEAVYIPGVYGTGFDAGYGEISITSMAYYYMAAQGATFEDVKGAGVCGVLADNTITFPAEALLISMANYQNGNWYKSNNNGAFKLDMTDMQPVETAAAKAPAMRNYVERELKNVEGGIQFGIRCKKIDNSFMNLIEAE